MRNVTLILVALSVLAQSIHFSWEDIRQLPTLSAHLAEHLNNGDDLNSFIELHYGSEAHEHEDEHEEHDDLPFKPDHWNMNFHVDYFMYENASKITFHPSHFTQDNFNYIELSSKELIEQFFQPPRA